MATGDPRPHCPACGYPRNLNGSYNMLEVILHRLARLEELLHLNAATFSPDTQLAAIEKDARDHPLDLPLDEGCPATNPFTGAVQVPAPPAAIRFAYEESEEGDAD